MMKFLFQTIFLLGFCFNMVNVQAQIQYTPYDQIPGLCTTCKPMYHEALPSWAKMLYAYPVNFKTIDDAFQTYQASHPKEKSSAIRYYKLWSKAVRPYTLADGSIALPNSFDQHSSRPKVEKNSSLRADLWSFVGPKETFWLKESPGAAIPPSTPEQANIYAIDIAKTNPNIMFCGTETGFINKSIDGGATWELLARDYFFGGAITDLAIDPTNADVIYVSGDNKLHKSTDGGLTWASLSSLGLVYIDKIIINPNNSNLIFASSPSGIRRSTDGGATWAKKDAATYFDIEFKPDNTSVIYGLANVNGNFTPKYSTDGGETFNVIPNFPTIVNSDGGVLAVTPDNASALYALMLSADNTPFLAKGVEANGSWSWAILAKGNTNALMLDNGQGFYDLDLGVSPVDENKILVATTTMFLTEDGGQSFNVIGGYYGNFDIHPDIQEIKMMDNGGTWLATDGGLSYSGDTYASQSQFKSRNKGLIGSDFWGFDQGWNEDIVVGGRYHNGNTAIADFYGDKALRMGGAESPTGWIVHGKKRHVAFDDLGGGWILPKKAEDPYEGRFIFSKFPNMYEYGGRRGNVVHHPNYYEKIYLGSGKGFWLSNDMGTTWDLLSQFDGDVAYFQISFSNPNVIYANVHGKGLMKSTDGGKNWVHMPSLTSGANGNSYWNDKLFIALSPTDENTLYVCLQNGTWSEDYGQVFKSTDGGLTWTDWTSGLHVLLKSLVVQPTADGRDLVYLFAQGNTNQDAEVFKRYEDQTTWTKYDNNYPANMRVNMSMPFFRDAKLRLGGNAGVWEAPMAETSWIPVVNPWVANEKNKCFLDTLYFEDHSMVNHDGASWHWEITPAPAYIENANMRNPKVVLGAAGSYTVSLTVSQGGFAATKTIPNMVTTTSCPSLTDCGNPASLPKNKWGLIYFDSEEVNYPGLAEMAFDDDINTIWHTRWSTGNDPYPHEMQIALGDEYSISEFTYLGRQDGGENGRVSTYLLYISSDSLEWGEPVSASNFVNDASPKVINFDPPVVGKYFKFIALDEVNQGPWTSAAEFYMKGCYHEPNATGEQVVKNITAFPLPTNGLIHVDLPYLGKVNYQIFNTQGRRIDQGEKQSTNQGFDVDCSTFPAGVYVVHCTANGQQYRLKVVKQ